jgi:predicted TIM-barrel fold metal-dependent hydrolase
MIDFHTHPIMIKELMNMDEDLEKNIREILGFYFPPQPLKVFFNEMDAAGIDQCVILPVDCTTRFGCELPSNEMVASLANKYPRLIGFASVDPKDKGSEKRLEHAIKTLGLKGLKLNPALQKFSADSKEFAYPIYQLCCELGIPVMIHCGLSWSPKADSKLANPLDLEIVAQDFPSLKIIIPHLGWPWMNEAIMLAVKFNNIFLDTSVLYSGTPGELLNHLIGAVLSKDLFERSLHYQIIFGSNYPRVDIRRSVAGINSLGFSKSLQEHLSYKNAMGLLKNEKSI